MELLALALGCLVAPAVASFSVPSPSSVGSDITLLYYNDVDRKLHGSPLSTSNSQYLVYTASEHKSVLLLSSFSNSEAASACAELGETLLPANESFFQTELVPSLQYQVYQGHYGEGQLYWVQSTGSTCEAVNVQGFLVPAACDLELPALCSQSAQFSASAEPTNSLIVHANDLTLIG